MYTAIILGFFFQSICSHSVLGGMISGIIVVCVINFWYKDRNFSFATVPLPPVMWGGFANLGVVFIIELILRQSGKHPGFEPQAEGKKQFCGFGPLDPGYVGFDMSLVKGPKQEPFQPYWATVMVVFLVYLAFPYWCEKDKWDINYVGGVPWWAVVCFFISACATTTTMVQSHFFYEDWMTEEDYAKHRTDSPAVQMTDGAVEASGTAQI